VTVSPERWPSRNRALRQNFWFSKPSLELYSARKIVPFVAYPVIAPPIARPGCATHRTGGWGCCVPPSFPLPAAVASSISTTIGRITVPLLCEDSTQRTQNTPIVPRTRTAPAGFDSEFDSDSDFDDLSALSSPRGPRGAGFTCRPLPRTPFPPFSAPTPPGAGAPYLFLTATSHPYQSFKSVSSVFRFSNHDHESLPPSTQSGARWFESLLPSFISVFSVFSVVRSSPSTSTTGSPQPSFHLVFFVLFVVQA